MNNIERRIEKILEQYPIFNGKCGHTIRQNIAHVLVEELGLTTETHHYSEFDSKAVPGGRTMTYICHASQTRYTTPWVRDD